MHAPKAMFAAMAVMVMAFAGCDRRDPPAAPAGDSSATPPAATMPASPPMPPASAASQ